jgi:HAD superfamily hydrolase (TIGR01509 family)
MQFEGIILDSDGTLVDSEKLAMEVLVQHVGEYGLILTADELLALFKGKRLAESVERLSALSGTLLPDSFVPEFRRRMGETFAKRLQAIAGATDLVKALKIPYCVASNGPRDKIELSLRLTGLLPYFEEGRIFSAFDVGVWKPDPGLFLHAAKAMQLQPNNCAVVEDSLPGITAGIAAGMTVFALQVDAPDPQIPAGVRIVRSLSELHDLLCLISDCLQPVPFETGHLPDV